MIEFFFPLFAPLLCATVAYDYSAFHCGEIASYAVELSEVPVYDPATRRLYTDLLFKDGAE